MPYGRRLPLFFHFRAGADSVQVRGMVCRPGEFGHGASEWRVGTAALRSVRFSSLYVEVVETPSHYIQNNAVTSGKLHARLGRVYWPWREETHLLPQNDNLPRRCSCGNSFGGSKFPRVPEDKCSVACSGDRTQRCGAVGMYSTYT